MINGPLGRVKFESFFTTAQQKSILFVTKMLYDTAVLWEKSVGQAGARHAYRRGS